MPYDIETNTSTLPKWLQKIVDVFKKKTKEVRRTPVKRFLTIYFLAVFAISIIQLRDVPRPDPKSSRVPLAWTR